MSEGEGEGGGGGFHAVISQLLKRADERAKVNDGEPSLNVSGVLELRPGLCERVNQLCFLRRPLLACSPAPPLSGSDMPLNHKRGQAEREQQSDVGTLPLDSPITTFSSGNNKVMLEADCMAAHR